MYPGTCFFAIPELVVAAAAETDITATSAESF
jgi:hypothetical protein